MNLRTLWVCGLLLSCAQSGQIQAQSGASSIYHLKVLDAGDSGDPSLVWLELRLRSPQTALAPPEDDGGSISVVCDPDVHLCARLRAAKEAGEALVVVVGS